MKTTDWRQCNTWYAQLQIYVFIVADLKQLKFLALSITESFEIPDKFATDESFARIVQRGIFLQLKRREI